MSLNSSLSRTDPTRSSASTLPPRWLLGVLLHLWRILVFLEIQGCYTLNFYQHYDRMFNFNQDSQRQKSLEDILCVEVLWKEDGRRDKAESDVLAEGWAAELTCRQQPGKAREGGGGTGNRVETPEVMEAKEESHLLLRCAGTRKAQSTPKPPLWAPGCSRCKV